VPVASRRIDPAPTAVIANPKPASAPGIAPLLTLPDPIDTTTLPPVVPVPGTGPVDRNAPALAPLGAPGPVPGPATAPIPALPVPGDGGQAMNPGPLPPPSLENTVADNAAPGMPVQAPQRRGPISSLFNGLSSWLRR
jgi:hypothetical protein